MYSDYKTPLLEQCKSLSHISEDLKLSIKKYQYDVNIWVDYRLNVIYALKNDCAQLEVYEKNSLLSRVAGSLIGLASGGATIYGILYSPPLMTSGLIVGAVTGISNTAALYVNWQNGKNKIEQLQKYIEKDEQLLKKVVESQIKILNMMEKDVSNETVINEQALTLIECVQDLKTNSKPLERIRIIVAQLENGLETVLGTNNVIVAKRAYENYQIKKLKDVDLIEC